MVCAANALQPYRQNDNGWDQGLLFLDPCHVWGQPPYYVTQMVAQGYQPNCVAVDCDHPDQALDVVALASDDGRELTLQVVNVTAEPVDAAIEITGFAGPAPTISATRLTGGIDDTNTPDQPTKVTPTPVSANCERDSQGRVTTRVAVPGYSFHTVRLSSGS